MIKRFLIVLLAVFLAGTLCFAGGQKKVSPTEKKELTIVVWEIPYGLDPVHEYTPGELHSLGAIEYLLRLTPDAQIEPELAESYRAIDSTTWEVKIRPNVKFWSGKKVDAEAVKASLERSRKLCPMAGPLLKGVKIDVVDERTLHFKTKVPNPYLPLNLTNPVLAIHNADSYGPKDNPFNIKAMDLTGFFRVTEFKPKQEMVLERWDGYWGRKPKIDRIIYKQVADPDSRVLAALSGEAHIVSHIKPELIPSLKGNKDIDVVVIQKPSVGSVYLNLKSPLLEDVRVRKALAWGTDRQELVKLARGGFGKPAPSWFAANPAYSEAVNMGYTKYDPERAIKLLEEAGWHLDKNGVRKKDGLILKIRLLSYGGNKPASELLQAQWKKLGVQVEVQHSPDYGIAQSKRSEGAWEAVIESWNTFPAYLSLWRHFSPKGDINYGPVNDPTINQILKEMSVTFDKQEFNKLVYEANQWIIDYVPIIPLYSTVNIKAVNKKVTGLLEHFFFWQYEITPDTDIIE